MSKAMSCPRRARLVDHLDAAQAASVVAARDQVADLQLHFGVARDADRLPRPPRRHDPARSRVCVAKNLPARPVSRASAVSSSSDDPRFARVFEADRIADGAFGQAFAQKIAHVRDFALVRGALLQAERREPKLPVRHQRHHVDGGPRGFELFEIAAEPCQVSGIELSKP